MANNSETLNYFVNARDEIAGVSGEVTPADIDTYGRMLSIHSESERQHEVLLQWKNDRDSYRQLRYEYAMALLRCMVFQTVILSLIVILVGCGVLRLDTQVLNILVVSVYAELIGLVALVVRYLFPSESQSIAELRISE